MEQTTEALKKELTIMEDDACIAYLNPHPMTPGTTIIEFKRNEREITNVFQMNLNEYKYLLVQAQNIAKLLCKNLSVRRCALIAEPMRPQIKLIPLHGLNHEWQPVIHQEVEFHETYPGYCDSKNGPRLSDDALNQMQKMLSMQHELGTANYEFFGKSDDMNLFARIVRGEEPQWRVWENADHVAFLTPFANTPGFTVLVPRAHLSSDIFSLEAEEYDKLIEAAYTVSAQIRAALSVKSTCMIFEGFEIDYAHAKLIPVHENESTPEILSKPLPTVFYPEYTGYVTTLNGPPFPNDELHKILNKLRKAIS